MRYMSRWISKHIVIFLCFILISFCLCDTKNISKMIKQYFHFSLLLYIIIYTSFVLTDTNTASVSSTELNLNQTNTSTSKLDSKNSVNFVQTEGGQIDVPKHNVHLGREHITSTVSPTTTKINTSVAQELKTKNYTVSPISVSNNTVEKPVIESMHTDSRVKPRKGVYLNDTFVTEPKSDIQTTTISNTQSSTILSSSTQKSTTTTVTTTFIPKKPTVTFGSDEEDPPLHMSKSRVFLGGKEVGPKNSSIPTILAGDPVIVGNRHKKGSDYVLPIVLTILAVPLVAIILTVVYKRGAEWWSHRHYRRMDFLIDGMYNN